MNFILKNCFALANITLIYISALYLVQGASPIENDCANFRWNDTLTECPHAKHETFKFFDGETGEWETYCCDPGSFGEKLLLKHSTSCQVTKCLPPNSLPKDLCNLPEDAVFANGTRLVYEEHLRETCNDGGIFAYCCLPNTTESLLVSALGAEKNEFPHQVYLRSPENYDLLCGATIYNKRFVVTAAHCVVDEDGTFIPAADIQISAGTNIAGEKPYRYLYNVSSVIVHPNFSLLANHTEQRKPENEQRIFNDVAVLDLKQEIKFEDRVKALEIATEGFVPSKYAENAVLVGWGTTDTLKLVPHLQKANLIIRSDGKCFRENGRYEEEQEFKDQLICLGGILEGKWSPVAGSGDSGGAAICRNFNGNPVLCGITSYGDDDGNCKVNNDEESCPPTVFADVGYFHKWITEKAGAQDPETFYKPYLYEKEVSRDTFEHQVHISSDDGTACGGTLIAEDIVITAAHCIFSREGTNQVQSGLKITTSDNLPGNNSEFGIKDAKFLPGWKLVGNIWTGEGKVNVTMQGQQVIISDDYYHNNLAVVKLNRKTSISVDKLAVLPDSDDEPFTEAIEVSVPKNSLNLTRLRSREFKLISNEQCQKRMDRMGVAGVNIKVDDDLICGVEKYSGGSTCDRGLGFGLICKDKTGKDVVCGVQVFRLCMYALPNWFVNVNIHKDFIQRAVKEFS